MLVKKINHVSSAYVNVLKEKHIWNTRT